MSFLRAAVVVFCFGAMLAGVSATGFSAQLTQSAINGAQNLAIGANSITVGGATWTTTAASGFTDGQFNTADGVYSIPVQGFYHFDATVNVQVEQTGSINMPVDLRVVKCNNGCNAICTGGNFLAQTIAQSNFFISDGLNGAHTPMYAVSVAFTGAFNTGDLVALCLDQSANSGIIQLNCQTNLCTFSGFSV